jgi:acyl carrier protein
VTGLSASVLYGGKRLNPTGTGLNRLQEAFVQAIGVAPDADFESIAYGSTRGWDSTAHMTLVAEIETAFDIMLSSEEVIDLSSFAKAREIVSRHGAALD